MSTPFHRAAVMLRHARSVVVCGHVRPDGDALGSVLGLTLALRELGVPAVPTLADSDAQPPGTYAFLPGFGLFAPITDLETPEVFVAIDTPNLERLGNAADMARAAETIVVIDHHPDNVEFGEVNVVDSSAAASGQLVWRLIERLEVEPDAEMALCCYVGLMTDTGRFQYDNTSPDALRDAASMIEHGVSAAEASRLVYQERTAGSLKLQALAMSRIEIVNQGLVAWSWITDPDFVVTSARPEETEFLPDAVREVGGVEVVVLLRQADGEVRGNLRSKSGFDVGSVARSFGGGGHRAASGFTAQGTIDDVLPELLSRLPGGS